MLRMVDAPNERGRTHHHHYSYFAVVGISIFDTRIVSPLTSPVRFEVVPQNMPLLLADFSGTCWMTSQCSTILPSLRRKKFRVPVPQQVHAPDELVGTVCDCRVVLYVPWDEVVGGRLLGISREPRRVVIDHDPLVVC